MNASSVVVLVATAILAWFLFASMGQLQGPQELPVPPSDANYSIAQ